MSKLFVYYVTVCENQKNGFIILYQLIRYLQLDLRNAPSTTTHSKFLWIDASRILSTKFPYPVSAGP